jgi:hypothetical protein
MILVPWLITAIKYYSSDKRKVPTKRDTIRNARRKEKAMDEIRKIRNERLQKEWNNYYRRYPFTFIDKISESKFIDLLVRLLRENTDYFDVRKIDDSDETANHDINILCLDSRSYRIGVLVQKTSNHIQPSAVEQLISGMNHYGCSMGIIAATSEFTFSAIKLAGKDNRIELWDREHLEKLYYDTIPAEIPPFSMEKAKQLGLPFKIRLTKIEKEILFRKYGLDYDDDYDLQDVIG